MEMERNRHTYLILTVRSIRVHSGRLPSAVVLVCPLAARNYGIDHIIVYMMARL